MQETACCVNDECRIDIDPAVMQSVEETVRERIRCRLELFEKAIGLNKEVLEIDGVSVNGEPCHEVSDMSRIKIVNHKTQEAVEVEIDTIVRTPLEALIDALITGECIKLYGVTRIVGYYSRINNWNKSKIGELRDRHRGNYAVHQQP